MWLNATSRVVLLLAVVVQTFVSSAGAADLSLRYDAPAPNTPQGWERWSLPIGNGRLGGNFFGGVASERFSFNEITLWTGNETNQGSYQAFGNLTLLLPGHDEGATNYSRELDLENGVGRVTYKKGEITYRREYFASYPDQVVVIHLTADKPGAYSGQIALADMHDAPTKLTRNVMTASGALILPNPPARGQGGSPPGSRIDVSPVVPTMSYESRVAVINDGGSIASTEGAITFSGCNSLTILLVAGTDYVADYARGFRGESPNARLIP